MFSKFGKIRNKSKTHIRKWKLTDSLEKQVEDPKFIQSQTKNFFHGLYGRRSFKNEEEWLH